jgi:hypothetical protein
MLYLSQQIERQLIKANNFIDISLLFLIYYLLSQFLFSISILCHCSKKTAEKLTLYTGEKKAASIENSQLSMVVVCQ